MTPTLPSSIDVDAATVARPGMRRAVAAFRAKFGFRRVALALAICFVVSTRALIQPTLYRPFDLEGVVRAWLDYFGECLLMGTPILLAVTAAEALTARRSHWVVVPSIGASLVFGAAAGALALVVYYDADWEGVLDVRLALDVVYWTVIGAALSIIHGLQQRTAAAAAAAHQAEVDRIALSKQMFEAQLLVTRAQVEPHFLFNTLANVKRLVASDVPGGVAMLDNLTRYLRAALPRMRDDAGTLGQEADLVHSYLEVLRIRMGERLRYTIDVPAPLRSHAFPPMMLLTLVENAVKHGLDPSPDGGMIEVGASVAGDTLEVRVADSGVGFGGAATGGTGVGLANIRARLAALHGEQASLSLAPSRPSGVVAAIAVPYVCPLRAPRVADGAR